MIDVILRVFTVTSVTLLRTGAACGAGSAGVGLLAAGVAKAEAGGVGLAAPAGVPGAEVVAGTCAGAGVPAAGICGVKLAASSAAGARLAAAGGPAAELPAGAGACARLGAAPPADAGLAGAETIGPALLEMPSTTLSAPLALVEGVAEAEVLGAFTASVATACAAVSRVGCDMIRALQHHIASRSRNNLQLDMIWLFTPAQRKVPRKPSLLMARTVLTAMICGADVRSILYNIISA